MAALAKTVNTLGLDRVCETVLSIYDDLESGREPRFPSETVFIASDLPDFAGMLQDARAEGSPVAVIYPDGSEDLLPARPRR